MLQAVAPYTDRVCDYAVCMPNVEPPVIDVESFNNYYTEVRKVLKHTTVLPTFKLVPSTFPEHVRELKAAGAVAAKLYPSGVTTNSHDGIPRDWLERPENHPAWVEVLETLEDENLVLCLHGEMPGHFCLDREVAFEKFVYWLIRRFPALRVVWEHITTGEVVEQILSWLGLGYTNLAATITLHHLMLTLDDVVGDKLQPHHFCKPIAKGWADRSMLWSVIEERHSHFFLGSDSAPHYIHNKECVEGCAGVFTAPYLAEMLVEQFDRRCALDCLPGFVSTFGNKFYGLAAPKRSLTFVQSPHVVEGEHLPVRPFGLGQTLQWQLVEE